MSETLANMQEIKGIDYSTEEQWTGLRWIDGKKIYQKTISIDKSFATTNPVWVYEIANVSELNINKLIDVKIIDNTGALICPFVLHRINNGFLSGYYALSGIGTQVLQSVTLQYTKTTD